MILEEEEEKKFNKPPYKTTDLEISIVASQCKIDFGGELNLLMTIEDAMFDIYH